MIYLERALHLSSVVEFARWSIATGLSNSLQIGRMRFEDAQDFHVLRALHDRCLSLSKSILILIEEDHPSDVQILERSLIEATVKFLYITGGELDVIERLHEFSTTLSDIQVGEDFQDIDRMANLMRSVLEVVKPGKIRVGREIYDFDGFSGYFENHARLETIASRAKKLDRKFVKGVKSRWNIYELVTSAFSGFPPVFAAEYLNRYMLGSNLTHASMPGLDMAAVEGALSPVSPQERLKYIYSIIDLTLFHNCLRSFLFSSHVKIEVFPSVLNRNLFIEEVSELLHQLPYTNFFIRALLHRA
ncbi:DUF5677 domain-containing protein [Neotabrizicola sp. sgz301269]|uniref:DUF5677 domain-containing protein n=1 Tax=Neotabrizicola sp. sgz301269 TaxID=3276282 RepID=UPI00376FA123